MDRRASSFGYRVGKLWRLNSLYMGERMAPLGLTRGQLPFLAELFHEENVTQDALAERLYMDKGVVARTLASLEDAGFVMRRLNPDNKRQYLVTLTEKAEALREEFMGILDEFTDILGARLTEEERQVVLTLLDKMIATMAERTGR